MRFFIALLFCTLPAMGATNLSPTLSLTDVRNTYWAGAAGDTLELPSGSATWTGTLSITNAVFVRAASNPTVDAHDWPDDCSVKITTDARPGIQIQPQNPAGNPSIRISGLKLISPGDTGTGAIGIDVANGTIANGQSNVRIDHCLFTNYVSQSPNPTGYGIRVSDADASWPCIDHNRFANNYVQIGCFGNSGSSWSTWPANPGSAGMPYVETNVFVLNVNISGFIIEGGQGGKYCFRHNTVTNWNVADGFYELMDMHGNNGPIAGDNRGTIEFEVYNNHVTADTDVDSFANVRGGTGKMFNNTVLNKALSISMTEYDGFSYCETADGAPPPTYPGDDPVTGTFFFNNIFNSSYKAPALANTAPCGCTYMGADRCDDFFLQINRDWFEPSYGLASNKPGSPSNGDFYGATDTGEIFQYTNSAWATFYAPYTYPHPLRNESGGSPGTPVTYVLPAAPRNLRIQR